MADKNHIILEKIVGHIDKITSYIAGLERATFLADTKAVEACVFNLRGQLLDLRLRDKNSGG